MKGLEDPDSEKAADAAKTLAEMVNKEGLEFREEVLRAGLFAHLWKQAKQGKLGWEDKWYNTIDSSKLSFKDELGSGAFAIVYKVCCVLCHITAILLLIGHCKPSSCVGNVQKQKEGGCCY
jgi:hypothetical protein